MEAQSGRSDRRGEGGADKAVAVEVGKVPAKSGPEAPPPVALPGSSVTAQPEKKAAANEGGKSGSGDKGSKGRDKDRPVFPFLPSWLQYNSVAGAVVVCLLAFLAFHAWRSKTHEDCWPTISRSSSWLDEAVGQGHWFHTSWSPNSCLLHPYTAKQTDMAACLNEHQVAFVGDSRVRQLYQAAVRTFVPGFEISQEHRHKDLSFNTTVEKDGASLNVHLSFKWRPNVFDADVEALYSSWSQRTGDATAPSLVVHSAGLWAMKRGQTSSLTKGIERLQTAMSALPQSTRVYWLPITRVDETRLWDARRNITNAGIDAFNAECKRILTSPAPTPVVFTDRILDMAHDFSATEDGLHFEDPLPRAQADLLLNTFCHGALGLRVGSRTCCAAPERTSTLQWLVIIAHIACCAAFAAALVQRLIAQYSAHQGHGHDDEESTAGLLPPPSAAAGDTGANGSNGGVVSRAAAKLSAAYSGATAASPHLKLFASVSACMLFIFVADRTDVFLVSAKEFTWSSFGLGCLVILAAGLVSVRKASTVGCLNRHQTDEWKGWMQLSFLLYHYTGASQVLPIYVFIRVCVAAYIFMTGFGHYIYFTKKKEFTWHRIVTVVLRVNIFTLFLCATMNRSYQFYYFVPLSTFWFLMVCLVMRVLRPLDPRLGLIKPIVLVAIAALLYHETVDGQTHGFDVLFDHDILAPLVKLNGSLHEWRFRSGLDRYAAAAGMLVGHFVHHGVTVSAWVRKAAIVVSFLVCASYVWFARSCSSKPECNARHVYISPVLLIAFVVLRNSTEHLRSHFSSFFGECGKTSLELFLAQYHAWLAVDTKGLLVLVPGHRFLNAVLCSLIFMVLSRTLATAFNGIVSAVLPKEATRNAIMARAAGLVLALYLLSSVAPK